MTVVYSFGAPTCVGVPMVHTEAVFSARTEQPPIRGAERHSTNAMGQISESATRASHFYIINIVVCSTLSATHRCASSVVVESFRIYLLVLHTSASSCRESIAFSWAAVKWKFGGSLSYCECDSGIVLKEGQ